MYVKCILDKEQEGGGGRSRYIWVFYFLGSFLKVVTLLIISCSWQRQALTNLHVSSSDVPSMRELK